MAINYISNLEQGASVREKLNEVITKTNLVPNKVDKIPTAQPGNVAVWGEGGVLLDSGVTPGGGAGSNVPDWETVRYDPLPIDYVVQFSGRLFTSKVEDNLNNMPPIEGDENDYWKLTTESKATGAPVWEAGTFLIERSEVLKLNISDNKYYKYILRAPVPFISEDFYLELLAGSWQILGSDGNSSGSSWLSVHVDSALIQEFIALPYTVYTIDASANPVLAKVPDAVLGNTDEFKFKLNIDTHKVTITTVGGTQLIGLGTSVIIPTIGASVQLKADNDHYGITDDTRQLASIVTITANRDFSTDGFENNIIYQIHPNGGEITILLPTAYVLSDNIVIRSHFEQIGSGRVSIGAATGLIGGESTIVLNDNNQGLDIIWAGLTYTTANDSRPKALTASFTSYPVSENSTINDTVTGTFFKQRVSTIEDPRFDKVTAVESSVVVTANPTDPYQVISSSITDAGVLIGEIAEGSINILANLRRTGVNLNVYFTYLKRTAAGVETLIATSSVIPVTSDTTLQYLASSVHAAFGMLVTDQLIVRMYGRKATTGTNPTAFWSVEGVNATRSTIEVAAGTIAHNTLAGRNLMGAHEVVAVTGAVSGIERSLSISTNNIDLDFNNYFQLVGSNRVAISANTTISFANATNARFATFKILITNLSTVTFPTGTISGDSRIASRIFTPLLNGNYTVSIFITSSDNEVVISQQPSI